MKDLVGYFGDLAPAVLRMNSRLMTNDKSIWSKVATLAF
jgi:hypothetical protein